MEWNLLEGVAVISPDGKASRLVFSLHLVTDSPAKAFAFFFIRMGICVWLECSLVFEFTFKCPETEAPSPLLAAFVWTAEAGHWHGLVVFPGVNCRLVGNVKCPQVVHNFFNFQ